MAYLGNSPGVASQRVETAFVATASQTVFTPTSGYTLGYCDVYLNGVKLVNGDDYTAADGVSITLATAAVANDSVVIVASFPRGLSDGYLKTESDALLAAKAPQATTYTKTEVDAALATKQAADAELATLAGMSASRATYLASEQAFSFRNRIINGDMRIDQRNAGASVSISSGAPAGAYVVDRWQIYASQNSKFTIQQNAGSVTPPPGYSNYLGATSSSAYTLGATDQFFIAQYIEGNNIADLGFGAAGAQSVTLSFWVRSSLTGAFGGCVSNGALTRNYPFGFTINSANTWEQKTVTVAGDTSGSWVTNNNSGLRVEFSLGTGSTYQGTANAWSGTNYLTAPTGATNIVSTNGATFYITGVQLEAGTVATPFERRDYGRELMMCQRYYWQWDSSDTQITPYVACWGGGYCRITGTHPTVMRANPTFSFIGTTGNGDWFSTIDDANYRNFGSPSLAGAHTKGFSFKFTDNGGGIGTPASGTAYIQSGRKFLVSAEL